MQLMPFHWAIRAGSMKKAKTVSGLAATRTSRSTASLPLVTKVPSPLLGRRRSRELLESARPKLIKKIPELGEPFRAGLVQPPRAISPLVHKPGGLQHLQVLRYCRPGDVEVSGDLAGRELAIGDESQDFLAPGLGKRSQAVFHTSNRKSSLTQLSSQGFRRSTT
jgi:hypothetical protein